MISDTNYEGDDDDVKKKSKSHSTSMPSSSASSSSSNPLSSSSVDLSESAPYLSQTLLKEFREWRKTASDATNAAQAALTQAQHDLKNAQSAKASAISAKNIDTRLLKKNTSTDPVFISMHKYGKDDRRSHVIDEQMLGQKEEFRRLSHLSYIDLQQNREEMLSLKRNESAIASKLKLGLEQAKSEELHQRRKDVLKLGAQVEKSRLEKALIQREAMNRRQQRVLQKQADIHAKKIALEREHDLKVYEQKKMNDMNNHDLEEDILRHAKQNDTVEQRRQLMDAAHRQWASETEMHYRQKYVDYLNHYNAKLQLLEAQIADKYEKAEARKKLKAEQVEVWRFYHEKAMKDRRSRVLSNIAVSRENDGNAVQLLEEKLKKDDIRISQLQANKKKQLQISYQRNHEREKKRSDYQSDLHRLDKSYHAETIGPADIEKNQDLHALVEKVESMDKDPQHNAERVASLSQRGYVDSCWCSMFFFTSFVIKCSDVLN
jgi:hypothetical protein